MKSALAALATIMLLTASPPAASTTPSPEPPPSPHAIRQAAATLTVMIIISAPGSHNVGSGTFYNLNRRPDEKPDWIILTNAHVTAKSPDGTVEVCWAVRQVCFRERMVHDARPWADAAVIRIGAGNIDAKGRRTLAEAAAVIRDWEVRPSEDRRPAMTVYSGGYPGAGRPRTGRELPAPIVTAGRVTDSGYTWIKNEDEWPVDGRRMIRHNAETAQGSSGGPLITAQGDLIGINTGANLKKPDDGLATSVFQIICGYRIFLEWEQDQERTAAQAWNADRLVQCRPSRTPG